MRLSSVVLSSSSYDEEITFAVHQQDPNNRYLLRAMVGVDAEEIIPKFYGFGTQAAARFYEYTMRPREIVMRVSLNPLFSVNEDVSVIRDAIYRLISRNRTGELTLTFMAGGTARCAIQGMIIKVEVPYFTQTPELQVTIRCNDPMFRSVVPFTPDLADLPTANPVALMDEPSTAPHGLSFKVEFTDDEPTFVIQDHPSTPDWEFEVTPDGGFLVGDQLHFSSEYQNKLVYLERTGDNRYLMDKIAPYSIWPQIFPGRTDLYFMQIASFDWVELEYYSAFWGL